MTARRLPRELGCVLTCNYPGCAARLQTGQIHLRGIRVYAATLGWIRGLDRGWHGKDGSGRASNLRWDICPEHAAVERQRKTERDARTEARRLAHAENSQRTPEERLAHRREMHKKRQRERREQERATAAHPSAADVAERMM